MKTLKVFLTLLIFIYFGKNSLSAQTLIADLDLASYKVEFNAVKDKSRIVSVLGVNCAACRYHRDYIRDYVMNQCDNPDLEWHILWFEDRSHPATRADAVSEAAYITDSRVKQWWFPSENTSKGGGFYFADQIAYDYGFSSWNGCPYFWDASLLYEAGDEWTATDPPNPYYCMSKVSTCCNSYIISIFKNKVDLLEVCDSSITSGIEEEAGLFQPSIYPNPNKGKFTVDFHHTNDEVILIKILDLFGRQIYFEESINLNDHRKVINISEMPVGIYLLQLIYDDAIVNSRVYIE